MCSCGFWNKHQEEYMYELSNIVQLQSLLFVMFSPVSIHFDVAWNIQYLCKRWFLFALDLSFLGLIIFLFFMEYHKVSSLHFLPKLLHLEYHIFKITVYCCYSNWSPVRLPGTECVASFIIFFWWTVHGSS